MGTAKYPNKPITFVVPFAAGGGGDAVARVLAKSLSERINKPVIVENRIGAGGNIGSAFVLQSPADGYTLLNMSSTYPIQAAVSKVPFDPIADMQPIIMVSRDPAVVLVNPSSPLKNAKDLPTPQARARKAHLRVGRHRLARASRHGRLAFILGVKLVHVPYKGSSQAFNDVLGKSVDMMLTSATFATPHIRPAKCARLASPAQAHADTARRRHFRGAGFRATRWSTGRRLRGRRACRPTSSPSLTGNSTRSSSRRRSRKVRGRGNDAVGGTPEQMMQIVRADIERWKASSRRPR